MVATPIKTFFLVTNRAYFNGDETTIYCVKVKEKTMIKETVMVVDTNCFPKAIKGGHFFAEGLWKYRSIKQAAYIGSWTKALSKSAIAKPMRKYVVGLRNIFSGSTKKAKRRQLLATTVIKETMTIKIDEPKATEKKAAYGFTAASPDWIESRHSELLFASLSFPFGKDLLRTDQESLQVKFIFGFFSRIRYTCCWVHRVSSDLEWNGALYTMFTYMQKIYIYRIPACYHFHLNLSFFSIYFYQVVRSVCGIVFLRYTW